MRDPAKIRCPKCRLRPNYYIEHWSEHYITFDAGFDGTANSQGELHDGAPYGVSAVCYCGNTWRLKGVSQIVELRAKEGETPHG